MTYILSVLKGLAVSVLEKVFSKIMGLVKNWFEQKALEKKNDEKVAAVDSAVTTAQKEITESGTISAESKDALRDATRAAVRGSFGDH
jgi:hypothetical protein